MRSALRTRIGHIAGLIGGISLLLGIIGLIWQGGFTQVVGVILAVGAVGVVLWIVLAPQDAVALVTGRQTRYGTVAVISSLVLIGIVVMVYILLQRAVITLDMTNAQAYSLSPETQQVIQRIPRPIQITGFYSPSSLQFRELDDQILRQYETESNGMIRRVFIDPQEQPAAVTNFGVQSDPDLFISFLNEDGTVDFDTIQRIPFEFSRVERNITRALQQLLVSGQFVVYFENSYSPLDAYSDEPRGIFGIINGLASYDILADEISLRNLEASGGTIPADASAVILSGGETQYTPGAIAIIDEYVQRGGALFILSDVYFTESPFLAHDDPFNQYLWDTFGLRTLDAVVVESESRGETEFDVYSFALTEDNQITARLNQPDDLNTAALFSQTRALEVNQTPPVPNGQAIASSPVSYGETNFEALRNNTEVNYDGPSEDYPGPLALVTWAQNPDTGAKVVLTGDMDFIRNERVQAPLGNAILFTDALTWLTGYSEQVTFGVQATINTPLIFIDTQTLDRIAFFTVIALPGAVLLMGVGVWWRRSRR